MGDEGSRFAVDAMLGSLARKLRVYGFDTLYAADLDDEALLKVTADEDRILLTADRSLAARCKKRGGRSLLLEGVKDEERLGSIFSSLGLAYFAPDPAHSRCPVCNGPLKRCERHEASGKVPPAVFNRVSEFYACASCGKFYWRGSHWLRLTEFSDRVASLLATGKASK